jgi:hypothetical protein
LLIDDQPIATVSAEELAAGINLAEYPTTPQMRQARAVLELVQQWQQTVAHQQRIIAEVEFWRIPDLPRPITLEVARPILLEYLEGLKTNPGRNADFNRANVERYFAAKPEEAAISARLKELERQIRKTTQPREHRYKIVPATGTR